MWIGVLQISYCSRYRYRRQAAHRVAGACRNVRKRYYICKQHAESGEADGSSCSAPGLDDSRADANVWFGKADRQSLLPHALHRLHASPLVAAASRLSILHGRCRRRRTSGRPGGSGESNAILSAERSSPIHLQKLQGAGATTLARFEVGRHLARLPLRSRAGAQPGNHARRPIRCGRISLAGLWTGIRPLLSGESGTGRGSESL